MCYRFQSWDSSKLDSSLTLALVCRICIEIKAWTRGWNIYSAQKNSKHEAYIFSASMYPKVVATPAESERGTMLDCFQKVNLSSSRFVFHSSSYRPATWLPIRDVPPYNIPSSLGGGGRTRGNQPTPWQIFWVNENLCVFFFKHMINVVSDVSCFLLLRLKRD